MKKLNGNGGSLVGMVLALGMAAGCSMDSSDSPVPDDDRRLELQIESEDHILGALDHELGRIAFDVVADSESLTVLVDLEDKHFSLVMDRDTPYFESDGGDATLNDRDRSLLLDLSAAVQVELEESELTRATAAFTGYLSEAPDGHPIVGRTVRNEFADGLSPRSTGNDGITCVNKGQTYTAYYTAGGNRQQSVRVGDDWGRNVAGSGNYDCMGRCGAACKPWWAFASAWTLDCLEHDVCSHNHAASGGGSDPNCGDEYDEAQDDWMWGVPNGCSG